MIRKSHLLLALALAAAAVAAPIAQSSSAPKVDPLAVELPDRPGPHPRAKSTSWTTGACSHAGEARLVLRDVRAAAAPEPVDPLAVSYLIGQGLTPSQVTSWTTGACSHAGQGRLVLRDAPDGGRPDGRPARSELPDRAGPLPEPGDVLDGGRLLAAGQGRLVLRDVRVGCDALHAGRAARPASSGATPASAPGSPSGSSSSSEARAPACSSHAGAAARGGARVSQVRVEE